MTAKTSAQRKSAERARKAQAGISEVRGIWAPVDKHAAIKAAVKQVLSKTNNADTP